jgi:hypothetical protein
VAKQYCHHTKWREQLVNSEEIENGLEAKYILESDVYKQAMQTLSDSYMGNWMNSRPNEVAERERAYTKLQILADFVNEVKTVMETGKMAEKQTEQAIGTHY